MTLPIGDAVRIRVIRALMGTTSRSFAQRIGVSAGTLTSWEKGRATPQNSHREELAKLCHEKKIGFLPSGMPVPFVDTLVYREDKSHG
jgi:transcriptional regulator with XRE-family HTH domain